MTEVVVGSFVLVQTVHRTQRCNEDMALVVVAELDSKITEPRTFILNSLLTSIQSAVIKLSRQLVDGRVLLLAGLKGVKTSRR